MAREYLDFDVQIDEGTGRQVRVAVRSPQVGEHDAIVVFPYDDQELADQRTLIETALTQSWDDRRRGISVEEQTAQPSAIQPEEVVREFGGRLFEALFGGTFGRMYGSALAKAEQQGKGLRIKLRIRSPRLFGVPWEYLFDTSQDEYVALSRSTTLVRYLEVPQPMRTLEVALPLRVLAMSANPSDYGKPLGLDREKQQVEEVMARLKEDGKVELTWLPGHTYRDLERVIIGEGPFHVFYFMGHSGFDRNIDKEGWLALETSDGRTDRLKAGDLARLLRDNGLQLVLLNSCEGARGSEQDVFSSVAASLVRRGVPAVLAMQFAISDPSAIHFARRFFEVLAAGLPVDAAVTEARISMYRELRGAPEWGTPVLFMRAPDGVLFDLAGQRRSVEQAAAPAPAATAELHPPARQEVAAPPSHGVSPDASERVVWPCPNCHRRLRAPADSRGKRVHCANCNAMVVVPDRSAAPSAVRTPLSKPSSDVPEAPEPDRRVTNAQRPISRKAVAALILGVFGLFFAIFGIPAVILGFEGLREINKSQGRLNGRSQAITGIITGVVSLVVIVIALTLYLLGWP